ncbi:MAG: NYN domain-containing protein [Thermoguttaceae bacterium]|nr:NYN domain-containing protein [Thermoguttaceae bacterium]
MKSTQSKILIDGYNMICALGILPGLGGRRALPVGKLAGARTSLLKLLANDLSEPYRRQTTVVFDALEPPKMVPDSFRYEGIEVVFSRGYDTADEYIIELILAQKRNADWMVVSSDHRIQNAARRRRMVFFDSDEWFYDRMPEPVKSPPKPIPKPKEKPEKPSCEDAAYWLSVFGGCDDETQG